MEELQSSEFGVQEERSRRDCKDGMRLQAPSRIRMLKFMKTFDEECSAAEFVATLRRSRGAARYRETNNCDPLCVKFSNCENFSL